MKTTMIMTTLTALLMAGSSTAATLHVAKDGSGDFTVIQDAIDAASPGDVIRIHAGRYEEMTEDWDVWGNGSSFADCHVVITKDDLTLQGDGPEATIIGPAEVAGSPDANYTGISVTYNEATALTVLDLAVENVRYGMYVASPECEISGCRFEGNVVDGVRLFTSSYCTITDCEIIGSGTGIHTFSPTANLTISDCSFLLPPTASARGCACIGTDNVSIADCQFVGGGGAIDFQQGTQGYVTGIVATQYQNYGVKLVLGGSAEVYDSILEGGLWAIVADGDGVTCERSVFRNQTYRTIYINAGLNRINDCEIINGGGYSVYCNYNATSDCHVDVTDCNWGTDSQEQIEEWIWDANDGSEFCCIVDFIPFEGPVATQAHSWSAVKDMFGGDARK